MGKEDISIRYQKELKMLREASNIVELIGDETYAYYIYKLVKNVIDAYSLKDVIIALGIYNYENAYRYGIIQDVNNIIHEINITELHKLTDEGIDKLFKKAVASIYKEAMAMDR